MLRTELLIRGSGNEICLCCSEHQTLNEPLGTRSPCPFIGDWVTCNTALNHLRYFVFANYRSPEIMCQAYFCDILLCFRDLTSMGLTAGCLAKY